MLNNIVNFFSLVKGKRVKKTLAPNDMIAVGVRDTTNRSDYQPAGITAKDFITQVGGVQSVTDNELGSVYVNNMDPLNPVISFTGINVDGTTITGNGTVGDPLVANYGGSGEYTYELGEYVPAQGGIIFHRYIDNGVQNYLVVAISDSSTSVAWDPRPVPPQLNVDSTWDGSGNTQIINSSITPPTIFSTAAYFATNNTSPSMPGWYLPAIDELSLLWQNRFNVNRTLSGNSSFGNISGATQIGYDYYWSSTEYDNSNAWFFFFSNGDANYNPKSNAFFVRAVRKFSI